MASSLSSSGSSSSSSAFLSADLVSLVAFGLISAIVTSLEKRKRSNNQKQQPKAPPQVPRPFIPPSKLARYLRDHGGRKWKHYDETVETFVRECPKVCAFVV